MHCIGDNKYERGTHVGKDVRSMWEGWNKTRKLGRQPTPCMMMTLHKLKSTITSHHPLFVYSPFLLGCGRRNEEERDTEERHSAIFDRIQSIVVDLKQLFGGCTYLRAPDPAISPGLSPGLFASNNKSIGPARTVAPSRSSLLLVRVGPT